MTQKLHPWENPEQDYARTLAKRRSERRYRSLQLVKTLKILLTEIFLLLTALNQMIKESVSSPFS